MTRKEYCYLAPCLVCGARYCDPHHVRKHAGLALKEDDSRTVPLCRAHHTECHFIGKRTFQAKYQIDFEWSIKRINAEYEEARAAD